MPDQPAAPYVFISYASVEQDRALAIADALQAAGIAVWLDRHAIVGGSAWSTAIVRAIRDCAAFALLGSARAFRSPNVQRELNLAVEENRPVVPLLLEQVTAPDDVRYALAGRQWVALLDRPVATWLPEVLRGPAGFGLLPGPPAGTETVRRVVPADADAPVSNLPIPLTSFVGREQELTELTRLLQTARLVTLTGPGGIGKTRLTREVARQLSATFAGGSAFVDLAPLRDAALVPSAIAQALGVAEAPGTPLLQRLRASLHSKQLLLVLDNFEQVVDAAPLVTALLETCPDLHVLVTSRAALHVGGEQEYRLGPLALPSREEKVTPATVSQHAALNLFIQRARAVRHDVPVTDATVPTIAAICRRLDGLPLALELAAARVRVLTPQALLARLDQRLPLLTGGARDAPARQQTLRDTIAWSYDLLGPEEQTLFRRLAVFVGGCTFEAIAAVCDADETGEVAVLDCLTALVAQSLLGQTPGQDGEPRFGMLETLREFAWEQLARSGELAIVRQQHARYFLDLSETIQPLLQTPDAERWFQHLLLERDNLRAAVQWSLDAGEPEVGMRIIYALGPIYMRVSVREARQWAEALLALPQAAGRTPARAQALGIAGTYAWLQSDEAALVTSMRESVSIWREVGGKADDLIMALTWLGMGLAFREEHAAALAAAKEALVLAQAHGSPWRAWALTTVGRVHGLAGNLQQGRQYFMDSVALYRELQVSNVFCLAALAGLGAVEVGPGDLRAARATVEEALPLGRAFGQVRDTPWVMENLGVVLIGSGEWTRAREILVEGVTLSRSQDDALMLAGCLGTFGLLALRQGQRERAVQLCGAAAAQFAALGTSAALMKFSGYVPQAELDALRSTLGEVFATAWDAGQALSTDDAVALAFADEVPAVAVQLSVQAHSTKARFPDGLTAREVEVLRLIATGQNTREIATMLVISEATVTRHVTNLYRKIGARGRADATAYAFRHQLVPGSDASAS